MARRLALLIGNNNYSDPRLSKLRKTDADVEALKAVLENRAIGFFDEVAVCKDITCEAARRQIGTLCANARKDDFLLLFFAGHGIPSPDRQTLYLAMSDTNLDLSPRATALEARQITELFDESHARSQLIILDCCFAGLAQRGARATVGSAANAIAAFRGKHRGRVLLTATDSTEAAFEGDDVVTGGSVNSVFTRFLIQGLTTGEADRGCDGAIDENELYDYVYEKVTAYSNSSQNPGRSIRESYGKLVVAKSTRNSISPELAHDFKGRLEYRRKAAAEELERLINGTDASQASAARGFLEAQANSADVEIVRIARQILAAHELQRKKAERIQKSVLKEAQSKIARGDFAGAVKLLDDGIQADPEDEELTKVRARARKLQHLTSEACGLAAGGKISAALAAIDTGLTSFPDDPTLRRLRKELRSQARRATSELSSIAGRATKLGAAGKIQQAIALVSGTLTQNPSAEELSVLLAELNLKLDRDTTIGQICDHAIERARQHDFAGGLEAIRAGLDRFPRDKRLIDVQQKIEIGRKGHEIGLFCKRILSKLTRAGRNATVPAAVRLRVRHRVGQGSFIARTVLGVAGLFALATIGISYVHYAQLVNERLKLVPGSQSGAPRPGSSTLLYAAPTSVAVLDSASPREIALTLQRAGYSENQNNPLGYYTLHPDAIDIFPGETSFFAREPAAIKFASGKVARIVSLTDHSDRTLYELEPQPLGDISATSATMARRAAFGEIPEPLRSAILATEDPEFFDTHIVPSPLTRQLARRLFVTHLSTGWWRRVSLFLMGFQLERKLSKQKIFELYCNELDFPDSHGGHVRGVMEAADFLFQRSLQELSLPEAATLVAISDDPPGSDPYRDVLGTRIGRNVVLGLMHQSGDLSTGEFQQASMAPLELKSPSTASALAPYFTDLVKSDLGSVLPDYVFGTRSDRIYTTLDLNLQRAASEAVRIGIEEVDRQIQKQKRFNGQTPPQPQVALVAMDPHTGEIKALIGGRDYEASKLNHAIAKRQAGSSFFPFVYAAAMETAFNNGGGLMLTPATTVVDEPTTFFFNDQEYQPSNFKDEFGGSVTLRDALARSLNVSTVKVAEMVGYDRVVQLAKRAGITEQIQPTPMVALGAFNITPIEAAGAYTIFSNQGAYVKPSIVTTVLSQEGKPYYEHRVERNQVLDPRSAYVIGQMMEETFRSGTAASVRARGFRAPAAAATGNSRDGWFAGYTGDLLCIVWVGFDDDRELNLEGSQSAGAIWAEFMTRALRYPQYGTVHSFEPPDGIVKETIDPDTGEVATASCPHIREEVFVAGTQPDQVCHLHGGGTRIAGWGPQPVQRRPVTTRPASVKQKTKKGISGPSPADPTSAVKTQNASQAPKPEPNAPSPTAPSDLKRSSWKRLLDAIK